MQIFQIKLVFQKQEKYIEKKFYYSILWAVLSLFENDDTIYKNIFKISYSFDNTHLFIFVSILWKQNFSLAINKILQEKWKVFSIDAYKFPLEQLDFNLKVLDLEKIVLNPIDKFELKFLSPTQIRNQNKIFTLPESDRFLFSVLNKFEKIWLNFEINKQEFKKWLRFSVIPKQFNIQTDLVEIKKSKRAGVVWNISYIVYDKNEEYQKILNLVLKLIPYIWIGSGTKLWLWNVVCKYKFSLWKIN